MTQMSLSETRIVFIGCGKMGEAMLKGWIASSKQPAEQLSSDNFTVVVPTAERRAYLSEAYNVPCFASPHEVPAADIVVLAVKPQIMAQVISEIEPLPAFASALFVSIAAGLTTSRLEKALPSTARLVRAMPNTPLMVGEGASAICSSATSTEDDVSLTTELFGCLGQAEIVGEESIDAIGALSGSGPAYVAAMIESLIKAGVAQGIDRELSESLTIQTVYGTMKLMHETGLSPAEVREAVSSPGGSTLAALAAMNEAGMDKVYYQGVAAAVHRSKELGAW